MADESFDIMHLVFRMKACVPVKFHIEKLCSVKSAAEIHLTPELHTVDTRDPEKTSS